LRRLLLAAGFPEASWQETVPIGGGVATTTPDAIFRPDDADLRPIAVYLDGMSAGLHGNAETLERDRMVRARLRELNWEVIQITAHELHDHTAMAKHFKNLARFLDRSDLRISVPERTDWFNLPEEETAFESSASDLQDQKNGSALVPFQTAAEADRRHFVNCLPLFKDLQIAAGLWGEEHGGFSETLESAEDWIIPPEGVRMRHGCFVARITGRSMEPKVPDGSWCLFGPPPEGSRNGKDLLVWHESIADRDGLGHFTLKRYSSEWTLTDDGLRHARITLKPLNSEFSPIELGPDEVGKLRIVAELLMVF
jgi:SOS-response transcriptional repressor LexA